MRVCDGCRRIEDAESGPPTDVEVLMAEDRVRT